MIGLGDLAGGTLNSIAFGASNDGSIIVGSGNSAFGTEAFRWSAPSGMLGIGDLPGGMFHSDAVGVSRDGSVVVGQGIDSVGNVAFRWTAVEGMVSLGRLAPGDSSNAQAVSNDGRIVVGSSGGKAFIWDSTQGMRDVNQLLAGAGVDLTGWQLGSVSAISPDGPAIAGSGVRGGRFEGWVAILTDCRLPGDANGDGLVNRMDLTRIAIHYGKRTGATFDEGDFTGDGAVSLQDLTLLRRYYARTESPPTAAVPEPAALYLMVVALAAAILLKRFKSGRSNRNRSTRCNSPEPDARRAARHGRVHSTLGVQPLGNIVGLLGDGNACG
jgi:hypothetical protein